MTQKTKQDIDEQLYNEFGYVLPMEDELDLCEFDESYEYGDYKETYVDLERHCIQISLATTTFSRTFTQIKIKIKVMKTNETIKSAKQGRPIVALSKRQEVLAARNAKREQGIEIKRGRPVTLLSKRQTVLATRAAKREQGIEIKRGRPKNITVNTGQPAHQIS